jgi:hypothetical protein
LFPKLLLTQCRLEITIAGATLLKGTGVSSRTTVNNKTMTPTARFATSKVIGQRG